MVVMSNFSFSHNVFKNCLLLMCQNEYLWSKGLTHFNIYFVNSWYLLFFNPIPNDKILNQSKLKAFADSKMNLTKKLKFAFEKVENIVGKKEKMLVTSIFSFSNNVFKRLLTQGC